MHIEITPENLLIQLGYTNSEVMLEQMNAIFKNTNNFDKFSKHILSLNDEIQHYGGYIAMSNSLGYLKIKTDNKKEEIVSAFLSTLEQWSDKYKVALEKVEGQNTFYIIGQK